MKKITKENKREIISLAISIALHFIFFALIIISGISSNQLPRINRQLITLESVQSDNQPELKPVEKEISDNAKQLNQTTQKNQSDLSNNVILNPDEIIADTTNLDQIYAEETLNLSIKYPRGWTYIDQNRKNKLDGVTFWSLEGIYNPPPYIHLEVVEKYLFNPNRYKYKARQFNCEWYFNDPVNIEGQISQEVYVRTNSEEDFVVKLIMKGEEQFKSFQSKFFAIVKSLSWSSSF
ncbi:MAG: hypothetical protein ACUVRG_12075 [Ignavibacterium sp.]|uniref:hypothetical protein n=1 Tax=Ignavibacterium sp. TaxID=2651167 RepID=UPI0040492214